VLIDGTLSSLDAKVARHVFEYGIKDLSRDKIVMMVTYDLDQAAEMDYVMFMEDGQLKTLAKSNEFFN
jgi:ABC-type transport system involved in cytochrome bd biosynthesis fused ATPase/permease subunit